MSEQAGRVPWRSTSDLETVCTYGDCSFIDVVHLYISAAHHLRMSASMQAHSGGWGGVGWEADECWGGSLDYVTSSGRPLELFPPLLREKKKEAFSLLRLSLSIWTNGKHAQGLLDISPHLHSVSPHHHQHQHTASPPLPLQRRIAVVTV